MGAWSPTLGVDARGAGAAVAVRQRRHRVRDAHHHRAGEPPRPARAASTRSCDPQRTVSYEAGARRRLGARGAWELRRLHRRASATRWSPSRWRARPGRQFFRNAGRARHRGVEAGASRVAAGAGSTARLAYAFTDARFRDYAVGGRRSWTATASPASRRTRWTRGWAGRARAGAFADAEVRHASAIPVDDANRFRSPAYTVVDLRAGWQGARLGRRPRDAVPGDHQPVRRRVQHLGGGERLRPALLRAGAGADAVRGDERGAGGREPR